MRLPMTILAALFGAAPAFAQEMPPLQDWVKGPAAKQDPSYLYTRCAGLYAALARYDQQSLMPGDTERMKRHYTTLVEAALAARSEKGGRPAEDYMNAVANDVGDFVDQYGGRIEESRAKTGKGLDGDPAMRGDYGVCQETAASLPES